MKIYLVNVPKQNTLLVLLIRSNSEILLNKFWWMFEIQWKQSATDVQNDDRPQAW